MRFIKFAEAKKAPNKLKRVVKQYNVAGREIKNTLLSAVDRKVGVWIGEGKSKGDVNNKLEAWKEKVITKRKALSSKNQTYIANKKIDKTVDDFNKAVQAPPNIVADIELNGKQRSIVENKLRESVETVKSPSSNQLLKPKGNKLGLKAAGVIGLTTLVVGGGVALHRKMRSDKGKKRGSYKNFNFPGELRNF